MRCSPSASTMSSRPEGMGLGTHSERSGRVVSGLRSMTTASRSVPATPSTSAWWVLDRIAQRPSSSPSTTQISHSGFERSSCWAIDAPDELSQFALAAGRRQGSVAEVVLDVEVRVVHPHRAPELERDEPHSLAVARHEVELGVDHVDDVGERWRRAFEDGDRCDVHVGHVVLDVEERRIQRAQSVGTHRSPPFGCTSARTLLPGGRPLRGRQPALAVATGWPSEPRRGEAATRCLVSS